MPGKSLVLALSVFAIAAVSFAAPQGPPSSQVRQRPYRPPSVPNCGGPQAGGVTLPRPDAGGDRLYFRLVDSAGYDFEIWCISGFASVYYEYRISFPDGTKTKIDECELFRGSNVVVLHVEGDSVVNDTTPNGAPLHRLRGRIRRYYHNNFNSSKDFHTVLDYGTGKMKRLDTRSVRGSNGRSYREFTGTSESTIDIPTPQPSGTPGSSIAPVHGGTVVRTVAPDPSIDYCTAEDSDSLSLTEQFLSDPAGDEAVYHLGSAGIDSVTENGRGVALTLREGHPGGGVSVAFPRSVGGSESTALVQVDGVTVPSVQSIAGSLRTLTFEVPEGSKVILIRSARLSLATWLPWLVTIAALILSLWVVRRRGAWKGVGEIAPGG